MFTPFGKVVHLVGHPAVTPEAALQVSAVLARSGILPALGLSSIIVCAPGAVRRLGPT
jgi:hypothetical protein